ncbi:MAG: ATPase domain-containing protein [Bdellovibrionota bacterium]
MQHKVTTSSGIKNLDESTGGYPGWVFNIVETPDHQSGLLLLGHFLKEGLKKGERCTIVTLEDPLALFQSFSTWGLDFYEYVRSEQLVFLFYQPFVTTEIGMTNDYRGLMKELEKLSVNPPERIAFHQVDALLNLHSHTLINSCVQKLAAAAASTSATVLAQYTQFNSRVYRDIRIAFMNNMPGFFTLKAEGRSPKSGNPLYRLTVDRVPWFHTDDERYLLELEKEHGFTAAEEGTIRNVDEAA